MHYQHQSNSGACAKLVGQKTVRYRPDNRSQAIHDPDHCAGMRPGAQSTSHVIDQKHHGRHQSGSHERVLSEQQVNARRCRLISRRCVRSHRMRGIRRPAEPAQRGQQQRQRAQSQPGRLQAEAQQRRYDGPGAGDSEADAQEDCATGQTSARRRNVRQHGCRHQHHDRATGNAGQQTPAEEPAHRQRISTGKKCCRDRQHHQSQSVAITQSMGHWPTEQGADQIADQIGRAEIDDIIGRKPLRLNQRRDQRRVSETRQANADQAGAKPGEDRQPDAGRVRSTHDCDLTRGVWRSAYRLSLLRICSD